jgi:hypothetical protein
MCVCVLLSHKQRFVTPTTKFLWRSDVHLSHRLIPRSQILRRDFMFSWAMRVFQKFQAPSRNGAQYSLLTDHALPPLYPQKLALTSPTSGGRSAGIVRSWTEATELVSLYCHNWIISFFFPFCILYLYLLPSISSSLLIVRSIIALFPFPSPLSSTLKYFPVPLIHFLNLSYIYLLTSFLQSPFPIYLKKNSMVLVRERTMPTERPPLVGEVSANFCW